MGLLNRLRQALTPRTFPALEAPSEAHPSPVAMYEQLFAELRDNWHEGGWAHLEVERDGAEPLVVQAGADGVVNACLEEVDLPALLRGVGLDALAELTTPADPPERSLWTIPNAAPAELAQAVHAVFARHHALGDAYHVKGWLEG